MENSTSYLLGADSGIQEPAVISEGQQQLLLGGAAQFEGAPDAQPITEVLAEIDAAQVVADAANTLEANSSLVVVSTDNAVTITGNESDSDVVLEEPAASAEAKLTVEPMKKITIKQNVYHVDVRSGGVRMIIQNCGLNEAQEAVDCNKPASVHYENTVFPDGTTREEALRLMIESGRLPEEATNDDLNRFGNDAALLAVLDGKEYLLHRALNVEGESGQITNVNIENVKAELLRQGLNPSDEQLQNLEIRLNIESAGWSSLKEGIELKHETTTTTTTSTTTTSTSVPETTTTSTTIPTTTTTEYYPLIPPVSVTTPDTTIPVVALPPQTTIRTPETVTTTTIGTPNLPPHLAETGASSVETGIFGAAIIAVGALAMRVRKLRLDTRRAH